MAIFADEFTDMMASTVTVQNLVSRGDDGTPSYSSPATYTVYIELNTKNVISQSGQLVVARGNIIMDTVDAISVDDLVTFSDGTTPVILNVNVLSDESGPAVTVLAFQ